MESDRMADVCIVVVILALFLGKIFGWITWPWIWITAIIWIPFALGLCLCISLIFVFIISSIINKIKEINK